MLVGFSIVQGFMFIVVSDQPFQAVKPLPHHRLFDIRQRESKYREDLFSPNGSVNLLEELLEAPGKHTGRVDLAEGDV